MTRYIRKAKLAEEAGVSRPRVTTLCKNKLAAACDGSLIDADHLDVQAWLQERDDRATAPKQEKPEPKRKKPAKQPQRKPEPPPNDAPMEVPDDIEAYADLTLRELVQRYGTDMRFETWLKSLKLIEEVQDKRLRNHQAAGKLVSREVVDRFIFGAIETTYTRLLNDSPKTIAGQVMAATKAGQSVEEIEKLVRDAISSQIKALKGKAQKALDNA